MHFRLLIIILLALSQAIVTNATDIPAPENGVLDLRNTTFDDKTVFRLNGEWEFYWEKLLKPEDFKDSSPSPDAVGAVPSYWSSFSTEDKVFSNFGYGTYRLVILFPKNFDRTLCFDIPIFDCSSEIYFNNERIGGNGKVGTSKETTEPWYAPFSVNYKPVDDSLQILINVANFNHRRGGFWQPILVGSSEIMVNKIERKRMYSATNIGILMFFSLFFLVFRIMSKKEQIMLFFALTALGILARTVNTGIFFSNLFIETPWVWQIRMEYTGTYLAHIFGMFYLNLMYPSSFVKKLTRINAIVFLICLVLVFVLPVHQFSYTMFLFQPAILLFMIYYLVRSFIGVIKLKLMDILFFLGLGFFLFALINDIMISNSQNAVTKDYFTHIAFQVFILVQATLLIKRWVDNFNERLALNQEIEYINKNLENMVHDRTEELEGKNKELETSLDFKSQILSIIAHDLKNPVSSLAQFSDLLLSDLELENKDEILRSLQQSSYAAVNLIDNLLYWGRNQSKQISFIPEKTDLKDVTKDVISLFEQMAKHKEIRMINDVPEGTFAECDKALTNMIMRNILSNAIKFTPRRGSVKVNAVSSVDEIELSVEDTGVGIPKDKLNLFMNDGMLETTTGTEFEKGTGLGMQLVRDLVKINRGILQISSEPGKGTRIAFTLPVASE